MIVMKLLQTQEKRFTAEQARTDFNELLAAFTDLHPNPFWSRSRNNFLRDIEKLVQSVQAQGNISEKEFFRMVARFVVAFDDPHCWVFVPGWTAYRNKGGHFFPLDLRFDDRSARVTGGDQRYFGSEVVRINEVPLSKLYAEFRLLTGQRDDPYGDEFLGIFFRRFLWFFYGWADQFQIRLREQGVERTVSVQGINQSEFEKRRTDPSGELPLAYRPLESGVGLVIFRSCVASAQIRSLAEPIFRTIRDSGVKKLVVDNRNNPGGGDDAWQTLLEFLTDKPFSAYSGSRYRISQRLKDLLGEKEINASYHSDAWTSPPGKEFVYKMSDNALLHPAANPLKFKGIWCLLAGRGSFSSGMSFVCAVKAYRLARIFGEETGGRVKGFGQWVEVSLPQSGLSVAVSTKQFDGSVDVPYRRGVPPDVLVRAAKGVELNSSADPVLKAALKYLHSTD
jgi:hypothetical protein